MRSYSGYLSDLVSGGLLSFSQCWPSSLATQFKRFKCPCEPAVPSSTTKKNTFCRDMYQSTEYILSHRSHPSGRPDPTRWRTIAERPLGQRALHPKMPWGGDGVSRAHQVAPCPHKHPNRPALTHSFLSPTMHGYITK